MRLHTLKCNADAKPRLSQDRLLVGCSSVLKVPQSIPGGYAQDFGRAPAGDTDHRDLICVGHG